MHSAPAQTWFHVNGVRLHCLVAGPTGGPPVLLLHGFPEFSFGWRRQIPALAAAGFRVVAPDLRGYNRSDKPPRVDDYRMAALVDDVIGMIDAIAPSGRAALVGHDWGGIIAWFAAMWRPDRVASLAVLNAPHPLAFQRELWRSSQALRSYYAAFFQLPWLPEALLRWDDFALPRRLFGREPTRGEDRSIAQRDVQAYIAALAQPRALTASINYYRAAFRERHSLMRRVERVRVPTLLIWGERDAYLVPGLAGGLEPWVSDLRVERLPRATHWVQHDEPARVNKLLIEHLAATFPVQAR